MRVDVVDDNTAVLIGDFKLERGEKKTFDMAWKKVAAQRVVRGEKRSLVSKSLSYFFYYRARSAGIPRDEALRISLPGI